MKYFAPSDAVWVTARDAGLIVRLPRAEARMYARLAHNYALQAAARDGFATACEHVDSLHTRYASTTRLYNMCEYLRLCVLRGHTGRRDFVTLTAETTVCGSTSKVKEFRRAHCDYT